MRKTRKHLIVLMIVVMLPMLLVGCKPKINADESAKVWFNYIVKGDMTSLSKIGLTEDEAKKRSQTQKDTYKKALKAGFESGGLKVEDKQIEQVYQAYQGAINKVWVSTEVVSQTSKESEVKVKETYITDMEAAIQQSLKDSRNQVKALKLTNEQAYNKKVLEIFINASIKDFKNAKISDFPKEKTFKFVIKDKRWVPEDASEFADYISKTAIGQ